MLVQLFKCFKVFPLIELATLLHSDIGAECNGALEPARVEWRRSVMCREKLELFSRHGAGSTACLHTLR